jgi:hypothetical protein
MTAGLSQNQIITAGVIELLRSRSALIFSLCDELYDATGWLHGSRSCLHSVLWYG